MARLLLALVMIPAQGLSSWSLAQLTSPHWGLRVGEGGYCTTLQRHSTLQNGLLLLPNGKKSWQNSIVKDLHPSKTIQLVYNTTINLTAFVFLGHGGWQGLRQWLQPHATHYNMPVLPGHSDQVSVPGNEATEVEEKKKNNMSPDYVLPCVVFFNSAIYKCDSPLFLLPLSAPQWRMCEKL